MYCVAVIIGLPGVARAESFAMSAGLTHETTSALAPKSIVVPSALAAFADSFL